MAYKNDQELNPELRALIIAYKQFFGTESGQKIMKDLKSYCIYNKPTLIKRPGEMIDTHEWAMLDGRKQVIEYIVRITEKDLPV